MKTAIVIPARYAATRLPGKLLLADTGKPLIQHVYERAAAVADADRVLVATDDEWIARAVGAFGGDAVLTGPHDSGSARVAEAARALDADIIVNLQGDEPEIDPDDIARLIGLQASSGAFASTLACPFPDAAASGPGSPDDPAAVKVIPGVEIGPGVFRARYFTRTVCAWPRDADGAIATPSAHYLHVGAYAFTRDSLAAYAAMPPGALEQSERLEQLRILENGEPMVVAQIARAAPGIDTQDDYDAFLARMKKGAA